MALAPKNTGQVTRWWWVRHAPVPNPEGRCYGQFDKDCDVSNDALFKHQAQMLPKGAVWSFLWEGAHFREEESVRQSAYVGFHKTRQLVLEADVAADAEVAWIFTLEQG